MTSRLVRAARSSMAVAHMKALYHAKVKKANLLTDYYRQLADQNPSKRRRMIIMVCYLTNRQGHQEMKRKKTSMMTPLSMTVELSLSLS